MGRLSSDFLRILVGCASHTVSKVWRTSLNKDVFAVWWPVRIKTERLYSTVNSLKRKSSEDKHSLPRIQTTKRLTCTLSFGHIRADKLQDIFTVRCTLISLVLQQLLYWVFFLPRTTISSERHQHGVGSECNQTLNPSRTTMTTCLFQSFPLELKVIQTSCQVVRPERGGWGKPSVASSCSGWTGCRSTCPPAM